MVIIGGTTHYTNLFFYIFFRYLKKNRFYSMNVYLNQWLMQSDSLAATIDLLFYLSIFPFWSKFHLVSTACQKGTGKKSHWTVCEPVSSWSFSVLGSIALYSHQQKLPVYQMWLYLFPNCKSACSNFCSILNIKNTVGTVFPMTTLLDPACWHRDRKKTREILQIRDSQFLGLEFKNDVSFQVHL